MALAGPPLQPLEYFFSTTLYQLNLALLNTITVLLFSQVDVLLFVYGDRKIRKGVQRTV